jgi:hypothetical protein
MILAETTDTSHYPGAAHFQPRLSAHQKDSSSFDHADLRASVESEEPP